MGVIGQKQGFESSSTHLLPLLSRTFLSPCFSSVCTAYLNSHFLLHFGPSHLLVDVNIQTVRLDFAWWILVGPGAERWVSDQSKPHPPAFRLSPQKSNEGQAAS